MTKNLKGIRLKLFSAFKLNERNNRCNNSVFCGECYFSSVSAVINSLAAVCLSDFILPAAVHFRGHKPVEKTQQWIAIGLGNYDGVF